jgi:exonuclease VII small subunit
VNARPRRHRPLQFEAMEDRLSCAAASGALAAAVPPISVAHVPGTAGAQALQDRGQARRDEAARRRVVAAFAGLDRALAALDQAITRLEAGGAAGPGALRGFNRGVARVDRATAQLERALGARPRVVQEADAIALERALDAIARLQGRALALFQGPAAPQSASGAAGG